MSFLAHIVDLTQKLNLIFMRDKFVKKHFWFGLCEMFFSEIVWFSKGQKGLRSLHKLMSSQS